jgi:cell division protein FtsI/penicillin-binding protein 2
MARTVQYGRLLLLACVLIAALTALGYRLVLLQVLRHDELRSLAQQNTQKIVQRQPLRGQIRDVRGNILATSVPTKIICADPSLIETNQAVLARFLAPLLHTNENFLAEKLRLQIRQVDGRNVTNKNVILQRRVSVETWQQIEQGLTNLSFGLDETKLKKSEALYYRNLRRRAIFAQDDQRREYPNRALAAHILGFIGGDEPQAGLGGIEWWFNAKLAGVGGWLRTETDIRRREMLAYREQDIEPRDGYNVALTIDAGLQYIVETELAEAMHEHTPISVCATVLRPQTGEILAMATLPNFDPNQAGAVANPACFRNRVISDMIEPGSTFKIVVVSGALNDQIVRLNDQFDCEHGAFHYAGHTLHDHERYGVLSVENIITKSSNIGAAKIGIQMGESRLYQYIRDFGFGTTTGLPLPGEARGLVYPLKKWYKVSLAQIPMGHGIAVTPLQMTMAMGAIANGGTLMRPMLIDRLEDSDGTVLARFSPQPVRQVMTPATARQMVEALKTVVTGDGTAVRAKLDSFTVAGKTGTAQKPEPDGTYSRTKFFSSFIGFFPADKPDLCISVVIDEPKNGHYGGQTAAPVFKNIAERAARYLNIKPDVQLDPGTNETLAVTGGNLLH